MQYRVIRQQSMPPTHRNSNEATLSADSAADAARSFFERHGVGPQQGTRVVNVHGLVGPAADRRPEVFEATIVVHQVSEPEAKPEPPAALRRQEDSSDARWKHLAERSE